MWTKNDEALEKMVDEIGMRAVLDALAGICAEKIEHIAINYPDTKRLRFAWAKVRTSCELAAMCAADHL